LQAPFEDVVFRAATCAHAATTPEALVGGLQPAFDQLQLPVFNIYEAVSDGRSHVLRLLAGNPHPAWHAHYVEHRLYSRDFRVRYALSSSSPFFGSEVLASGGDISAEDRAFAAVAAGFGLSESYVLPHRTTDNRVFAVVAVGPGREIDNPYRVALLCLASSLLHAGLRIEAEAVEASSVLARRRLTPRQLECLEWSRHGKSSADIGHILGLSPRTIDEHLAAVCEALGVRTRVQAVSTALTRGMLPLPAPATMDATRKVTGRGDVPPN
jgi:LuxR family quorum sensing-dependent transcriptional regulator